MPRRSVDRWERAETSMTRIDTTIWHCAVLAGVAALLAGCSSGGGAEALGGATAPNHPPLVDAGDVQIAQTGGRVMLRGAAIDPDGDAVAYRWRQTHGVGVTLTSATTRTASFDVPTVVDGEALEFELVVTDAKNLPAVDTTRVLVREGFSPCVIDAPPETLDIDRVFYQKHCDADGQAVMSPGEVADIAVQWVRYQMLEMLKRLPSAAREMIHNGSRVTVKSPTQALTEIPEYASLYVDYPDVDWDALPGVGAVMGRPITSTSEENVLCDANDPYRGFSVFIHEYAHAIHLIGLRLADPTFEERLRQAYDTAMATGLWANTYSASNHLEYWAEGVGIWFHAHWSSLDHPAVINTREKLAAYDDGLYRMIREYFSEDEIPLCPPVAL